MLNNKGFAITGILYTLLVLFSITLVSVLVGLNTRKKIMEKSVETLEGKYKYNSCGYKTTSTEAPETGKYIYKNGNLTCYAYISIGQTLTSTNVTYTNANCNANKVGLKLSEYCKK